MQAEDRPSGEPLAPLGDESAVMVGAHLGQVAERLKALGQGIAPAAAPQRHLQGLEVDAPRGQSIEIEGGPIGQRLGLERARVLSLHLLRRVTPEERSMNVVRVRP